METYWYTWHKLEQHLLFNVNPSVNLSYLKHLSPHKNTMCIPSLKNKKSIQKFSIQQLTLFTAVA